jgi:RNA polymerase sigma factor (sigma-70 family)
VSELSPALVEQALAGDRKAVRGLVDDLMPVIQARVAHALLRRGRAAEGRDVQQEIADMTQEVFVSLFRDRGQVLRAWDPAKGAGLRGFVGLVAAREVSSILRTRRQSPWTESPTPEEDLARQSGEVPGPEGEAESRELLAAILERLRERLTDRGLEMFQLLLIEELGAEEVAEKLRMTVEAVYAWRVRLGRMARAIREELASEQGPGKRKIK